MIRLKNKTDALFFSREFIHGYIVQSAINSFYGRREIAYADFAQPAAQGVSRWRLKCLIK